MHSESKQEAVEGKGYSGKDVLYREGAVGPFDVQRAADALLRQGIKPSVAAIRNHIGGGSPNTITPLLAKYWEKLGSRLGDEPESLERVPEALARVTELLWRRALEEARERLKIQQRPDTRLGAVEELQEQSEKLSVALAEARAREGEQLTHLAALCAERETLKVERTKLLALLKGAQTLLNQHAVRMANLERTRGTRLRKEVSRSSAAAAKPPRSKRQRHKTRQRRLKQAVRRRIK